VFDKRGETGLRPVRLSLLMPEGRGITARFR
jgi:hypothetical protein